LKLDMFMRLIKFGVNYRFGWGPVVAAY